jgi:two-component system chemotaxis response regulator CheB
MDKTSPDSETHAQENFIVAIGASAGGLPAVKELLAELPPDLNAPVVIAIHSEPASILRQALEFRSPLNIKTAEDGETLEKSTVYVVPGAKHAFFGGGQLRISSVVRDSGFRPSIDALFMTMAAEYGERAIGVILSGLLQDGMRGAQVVHDMGGRTIVQDPAEALHDSMPNSVIRSDHPKAILSATELGHWLTSVIGTPA